MPYISHLVGCMAGVQIHQQLWDSDLFELICFLIYEFDMSRYSALSASLSSSSDDPRFSSVANQTF